MTSPLRQRLQYLLSALSLLAVVALLVGGWAWWRMRGSLPQLDGTIAVAGLSAPVTVARDALGVPTITGESRVDVARAMGFVHAQDRFFQMDTLRRRAAGELSEIFGKVTLKLDREARLHGFRRIATRVVEQAEPAERAVLQAYTAGVNAGLASLAVKPWEYLALRVEPAPWTEVDSVLCIHAMWLDLQDHDASFELNRDALRRALGPTAVEFLAPRGNSWDAALDDSTFAPPPLPKFRFQRADESQPTAAVAPARAFPELDDEIPGSNAFALSGAHTAHGAALVANDMHLSLSVPHIWYRVALAWKDGGETRRATGVSLPGAVCLIVGSNEHIAWGLTNAYVDSVDVVSANLDPTAQTFYQTQSGWKPVEERNEEIKVKGEETDKLLVRWTEWGPVLGEGEGGRYQVLRWTAHDDGATNLHLLKMETATSAADAVALAHDTGVPPLNFIVGDSAGVVAWTFIGKLPRRVGFDGRLPVTWTYGDRRWDGWLKPEEIPIITSAAPEAAAEKSGAAREGILWNANHRPLGGATYTKLGDSGYDEGARARQIRDGLRALVQSGKKATPADLLAVQLDDRALFLDRWQKFLLEVLTDDAVARKKSRGELRALVQAWEGRAAVDAVGYRLVRAFRTRVAARALAPFADLATSYYPRFSYGKMAYDDALWQLVHEQPANLLNPEHRSWESLLLAAVDDVIAEADKNGVPLKRFTWGARNTLEMAHPLAGSLPGPLAKMFAMPAEPLPGDHDMPRVQGVSFGASERMVVAPGHEAEGTLSMPGGQSGHPLSKYFRAGHAAWAKGEATPLLPGPAEHTLTLSPR